MSGDRRVARTGGGLALVALAAGAVVGASHGGETPARAAGGDGAAAVATARVQRQTLVDRESVDGSLGYADERTVSAAGQGTLTRLPAAGHVVRPGEALYRVDDAPVVLLSGRVPAFRTLRHGDEGEDVAQLERGLRDLGHLAEDAVDDDFDGDTAVAVRAWQEDLGVDETGVVELGRVVFLPGARRVSAVKGELGGRAGGPVLVTTSTRREVAVDLAVSDQGLARRGDRVDVELPDGATVRGTITAVGTAAEPAGQDEEPTVPVTVRLRSREGTGRLDQAPVSVSLTRERRRDALTVPVTALVALRGGAYGVRRADGRLVRVEPGLAVDGDVEVDGPLREGDTVQVPR